MTPATRTIGVLLLFGIILLLAARGESIGQALGLAPAPRVLISLHE